MAINDGQPSAYDVVFPVYGGKLNSQKEFEPLNIFGTAFYINNNFFLTAGHTIKNAFANEIVAIGYQNEEGNVSFVQSRKNEIFESNDSGILITKIPRAKAYKWLLKKLAMLNDVVSVGYPYGYDSIYAETLVRSFKGHIISVGYFNEFKTKPSIYELSYQIPRGLSGAPLLFLHANTPLVCGMTNTNRITDMIVDSVKEIIEDGREIRRYERVESLHSGIAMQTESFFKLESKLLGCTILEYLTNEGLIVE